MTVFNWLEKLCIYVPDKIALKEFETGRALTYQQLDNISNRLSRQLTADLGIARGDRIALYADNCLEHFILFFVAQKTGAIIVPLNYRLAAKEIHQVLLDCTPKLLITEEKYLPNVAQFPLPASITHQWTLQELQQAGYGQRNVPESFTPRSLDEDDAIFILYTSGTTGLPKGVLYSHKMLFWNSINTTMRLDMSTDERTVCVLPLFHTGGLNALSTPLLHRGAYSCIMKKFDAETALRLLESEQATIFLAVPTILKLLAAAPNFHTADLSHMRFFIVGGEALPISVIELWHNRGIPIRQGFGMTEVGPSLFSLHQRDVVRKIGSIGVPNFYLHVRIVDENSQDVERGQVGELIFKGDVVTKGYWNNPTETAKAIKDGWLHSGDLARQDEEGFYYVVDRKKNMYISGGENVYPAEIEKALHEHPCVAEVAVIGVPDEKWGEVGKACVVVKEGASVNADELKAFCAERLAKYKVPKYVVFLDALPKNDIGKINRKMLKET